MSEGPGSVFLRQSGFSADSLFVKCMCGQPYKSCPSESPIAILLEMISYVKRVVKSSNSLCKSWESGLSI